MSPSDVKSPGGWTRLTNLIAENKVRIGLSASALGALVVFGVMNGRQAAHWCNPVIDNTKARYQQIFSCQNPLSETGVVLASLNQGVYLDKNPATVGTINVGVGTTATQSGNNIFDDLVLTHSRTFRPTFGSGATAMAGSGVVIVPPGGYINGYNGTASGSSNAPAAVGFALFEIIPCTDTGLDC